MWDELTSICGTFTQASGFSVPGIIITLTKGTIIRIPNTGSARQRLEIPGVHHIRYFGELVHYLFLMSFDMRYKRAIEQYNSGEWVDFGNIALRNQGFRVNRREYLWKDISDIRKKDALVVLYNAESENALCSVELFGLLNEDVFVQLLQETQGSRMKIEDNTL